MNLFSIENLKMELGGREVLDIPFLEISDGTITALTGPNGSGKTSLLLAICGLLCPQDGRLHYRGKVIQTLSAADLDSMRRELGIVLQSPYLFKTTVLNNVTYGLIRRGMPRMDAAVKGKRALSLVGLEGFGKRSHFALSGGEAQRVALARALVLEPAVLLLDEPFANVDAVSRSVIERVLLHENRLNRTSVVFTTHDLDQACRMAGKVVNLYRGKVQEGSMENLFHGMVRHRTSGPVFDTGSMEITIPTGPAKAMTASIPPESILISLTPVHASARNTFCGIITGASSRNGAIEVTVDVGETLVSRITEASYREMGLMLGMEVYLTFKAEAVRLY